MTGVVTRRLFQVTPEQNDRETERNLQNVDKYHPKNKMGRTNTYDTMIKRIANPQPKRSFCKERVGLSKHVQLWISVEDARRDELIKNANDKRGEECEQNVIK